jgi:uncharacterized integral membrane protein
MADTFVSKGLSRIKQLSPRAIAAIIIGVIALIFIFQNTRDARVDVLFWHSNRALWLWLLIVFAGGFIVGSIYPWFHRRRKSNAHPDSETPVPKDHPAS